VNILITGGNGYIAGRLAKYLSLNPKKYSLTVGSRDISKNFQKLDNVQYINTVWDCAQSLKDICKNQDVVIHLAGLNAKACAVDPQKALAFNYDKSKALMDAAVSMEVSRFIYLSTIHTYSPALEGAITEDTPTTNEHPYPSSKLAAEKELKILHNEKKIEGMTLRLSNSFGAPIDKSADCWMLLINDLCKQAVEKNKLILRSPKHVIRNYIPMKNTCEGIEHLINMPAELIQDGLFNLGSDYSLTIEQVVTKVVDSYQQLFDQPLLTVFNDDSAPEKTASLNYNIDKIKNTQYTPATTEDFTKEIQNLLTFCMKSFKNEE
jgi:UDP-glucose 4-epimerase